MRWNSVRPRDLMVCTALLGLVLVVTWMPSAQAAMSLVVSQPAIPIAGETSTPFTVDVTVDCVSLLLRAPGEAGEDLSFNFTAPASIEVIGPTKTVFSSTPCTGNIGTATQRFDYEALIHRDAPAFTEIPVGVEASLPDSLIDAPARANGSFKMAVQPELLFSAKAEPHIINLRGGDATFRYTLESRSNTPLDVAIQIDLNGTGTFDAPTSIHLGSKAAGDVDAAPATASFDLVYHAADDFGSASIRVRMDGAATQDATRHAPEVTSELLVTQEKKTQDAPGLGVGVLVVGVALLALLRRASGVL